MIVTEEEARKLDCVRPRFSGSGCDKCNASACMAWTPVEDGGNWNWKDGVGYEFEPIDPPLGRCGLCHVK